jgi:pimeloyl-ACP methyl ester carboxylesterase
MVHAQNIKNTSTIIQTAKGPVETLVVGDGPAVIILHGALGGYDLARVYSFPEDGFKFILPSLPGYLRTPLSVGSTANEQAEATAALLDALGIEKAAVIGCSAGGPPAIRFAHRYPDRCSALVLGNAINAPLHRWQLLQPLARVLFRWDWLTWFGVNRGVLFLLRPNLGRQTWGSPVKQRRVKAMLRSIHPTSCRLEGFLNDLAQMQDGATFPLDQIRVPTLVVHGTADVVVPYRQGQYSASVIPNAQFLSIPGGTHLCFISHSEIIRTTLVQFLGSISQR